MITTLNTMVSKRLLKRRKAGKAYLFAPRVERTAITGGMLGDVMQRAFDGSAAAVMLSLFDQADLDADDLRELRTLINRKLKGDA